MAPATNSAPSVLNTSNAQSANDTTHQAAKKAARSSGVSRPRGRPWAIRLNCREADLRLRSSTWRSLKRRPDLHLRAHPRDHLVGELAGGGVAAEVRGADA